MQTYICESCGHTICTVPGCKATERALAEVWARRTTAVVTEEAKRAYEDRAALKAGKIGLKEHERWHGRSL